MDYKPLGQNKLLPLEIACGHPAIPVTEKQSRAPADSQLWQADI